MTDPQEGSSALRVLQVTARYYPDSGGIETHVHEVAARLGSSGVTLTVLATDRSGALPPREARPGYTVERVRAWPRGRDWYFAPGLFRRIVRGHEQLVHCQGVHTLVPAIAMLACVVARRPFVITCHTGGHSARHRSAARRLQWLLLAPLLRRARILIGVSQFEAEMFRKVTRLPSSRVRVIRNGGSLPSLEGEPPHLDPERPLILSVGRLESYKGHQRLIEAMPHVLEHVPGARALILGTGPYEPELRALTMQLGLDDAVQIDYVPGGDRLAMARQVASASLVVMLSDYEAHPVAVMEALTVGRPVLVTATSGLQELAEAGLVPAIALDSDAPAVAGAVLTQLRAPFVPPGEVTLPTWDQCADALQMAYLDALAGP